VGLRGAFYEFTWRTGLSALASAAQRGADVQLVLHGRDRDIPDGGADMTADDNRAAVTAADLTDNVVWRTAANRSALQHNKFLVLTSNDQPVPVWTGSTNLTQGAVFGHLNVGHLIHDPNIAAQFLSYWTQLADPSATTGILRNWTGLHNPIDLTAPRRLRV
jgi:phosphatidylserine/phosphatidylglycerophosphate/cardiolipin synthase-like enzyme